MFKYTIKRLLQSLVTVLIVGTIVFLLMRMLPTDYFFTEDQLMKLTEEQKNEQLLAAGLLDPIPEQLLHFYGQIIRFDFGKSRRIQSGVDVIKVIENIFKNFVSDDFITAFTNVASSVVSVAIALFSVTFITFFFLRDSGLFYKIITLFFPERFYDNIQNALDSITTLLTRYFRGLFVESLIVMMVIAVSMTLFGMTLSNALITGLIMGTLNLIPYAGPVIGCLISMAMGMISPINGEIGYTLIVIASTIACVKLIDDFIIQPTLYSKRVNAHPLEVFIVILISGHIGGVMGMLLAIPSYTVLRVIASEFFSEYGVVRRLTGNIKEQ